MDNRLAAKPKRRRVVGRIGPCHAALREGVGLHGRAGVDLRRAELFGTLAHRPLVNLNSERAFTSCGRRKLPRHLSQRHDHLCCSFVAVLYLVRRRLADDRRQPARLRVRTERDRLARKVAIGAHHRHIGHEGRSAIEQLRHHMAKRVEIGLRLGVATQHLCRRVERRAEDKVAHGLVGGGGTFALPRQHLRDAKIQHLRARVAARRTGHNEDVCRLDVAVHDAGVVGLIERLEDIHRQPSNIGRAEPLRPCQERLERHPLHELHHEEG